MNVKVSDVEHVAALARLNLTSQEKVLYTRQFNDILQHIDRLNKLDLDQVEPTTYVQPIHNVFRSDEEVASRKELLNEVLQEAPERENGLFKVPPVIE